MSTNDPLAPKALTADMLDMLEQARSAETALRKIDLLRLNLAGESLFSIQ